MKINFIEKISIVRNKINPDSRSNANAAHLKKLRKSIDKVGILSPIIVSKVGKNRYKLLDGHRRFAVIEENDTVKDLPALVREDADRKLVSDTVFMGQINFGNKSFGANDYLEMFLNGGEEAVPENLILKIREVAEVLKDKDNSKLMKLLADKKSITTFYSVYVGICKYLGVSDEKNPQMKCTIMNYLFVKKDLIHIRNNFKNKSVDRLTTIIKKKQNL